MNLLENLGIKVSDQSKTRVILKMEIAAKHMQPYKLMHGGISAVLAETAASIGANLNIEDDEHVAVGVDITTHHLNPVKDGVLVTEATPVKVGNVIQTWTITTHLEGHAINTSLSTVTLKKVALKTV
ncbi:PaaI family thioesterase [Companilactobacillus versmoldensis]|uniref:Phenylacetic acid degradation-like protein n=1 Tax=Companilactobacillus versmoldensis DSM 14857 = KCTC 3814 TaxID=1423815 RepID=A0A0R1SD11_9LACO|nr:PaaI family thioesterase [Companilactobacillus versmoldensis]KRL67025.1 phenylacetic acid degradation-like protein [Companilactobacillus versmoldensis DSM 14857 = KCTC 3814]